MLHLPGVLGNDSSNLAVLDEEDDAVAGGAFDALEVQDAPQEAAAAMDVHNMPKSARELPKNPRAVSRRVSQPLFGAGAPRGIRQSYAAYLRELPTMQQSHPGQWVGFSQAGFIVARPSKHEVIRACEQQGLVAGQFVALFVE